MCGCWLLASGCWLLAAACCKSIVSQLPAAGGCIWKRGCFRSIQQSIKHLCQFKMLGLKMVCIYLIRTCRQCWHYTLEPTSSSMHLQAMLALPARTNFVFSSAAKTLRPHLTHKHQSQAATSAQRRRVCDIRHSIKHLYQLKMLGL